MRAAGATCQGDDVLRRVGHHRQLANACQLLSALVATNSVDDVRTRAGHRQQQ